MWFKRLRWIAVFYRKILHGAGQDILKPRPSGKKVADSLNWLDYYVMTFLDWIDTRVFFGGKRVRTLRGRVRSFGERRVTRYFDKCQFDYVYERPLVLDGITVHPDFYLPKFDVYVEFWGFADYDVRYRKTMRLKKKLYAKHGISVISLYPKHIRNLEKVFPDLLQKATGRDIPRQDS